MTKREFKSLIKREMKEIPLEKQEEFLEKIEICVSEIQNELWQRLESDYKKCPSCNKYSLKSKLEQIEKEEEFKDEVIRAADSWDGMDEYADITCKTIYYRCPYCRKLILNERKIKDSKNHYSRRH